jgi:hypothetical protein
MAKKEKRGRGQPTKYTDDMPEKLIEFFSKDPYVKNKDRFEATDFPSIASFSCLIGVDRTTVYAWAKAHPDFKESMNRCKDFQERYLTINGLKGTINATWAIFTAKNVLGWRDVKELPSDDQKNDDAFSENYAHWEKRKSER